MSNTINVPSSTAAAIVSISNIAPSNVIGARNGNSGISVTALSSQECSNGVTIPASAVGATLASSNSNLNMVMSMNSANCNNNVGNNTAGGTSLGQSLTVASQEDRTGKRGGRPLSTANFTPNEMILTLDAVEECLQSGHLLLSTLDWKTFFLPIAKRYLQSHFQMREVKSYKRKFNELARKVTAGGGAGNLPTTVAKAKELLARMERMAATSKPSQESERPERTRPETFTDNNKSTGKRRRYTEGSATEVQVDTEEEDDLSENNEETAHPTKRATTHESYLRFVSSVDSTLKQITATLKKQEQQVEACVQGLAELKEILLKRGMV